MSLHRNGKARREKESGEGLIGKKKQKEERIEGIRMKSDSLMMKEEENKRMETET